MPKVKSTTKKVTKRLDRVDLKSLGILAYDVDNIYPQRVIDIVNDSSTAVTAIRINEKFIAGNGMTNVDFGNTVINSKGMTVNKLVRKIAQSISNFKATSIQVNYNGLGQKTEINFIPFEFARLGLNEEKTDPRFKNKIAIYNDWDTVKRPKIDPKHVMYLHKYDPRQVIEQVESIEIKEKGLTEIEILSKQWEQYQGQVLYWTPDGSDEYPLSPYDSVLEDMLTEGQLKRFKHSTATTNFLASHILITGKEEASYDEDGNEIKNENGTIGETLKEFQGGDNAASIIHLETESEESPIKLERIELQDYDGIFEFTESSARKSILRPFLIPPVLILESEGASIGESKELANAAFYYNDVTAPERNIIEEILEELFDNFYYNINPSGDFSISPLKYEKPITLDYFPYYDKNEIRTSMGDDPVEDVSAGKTILAVELGVGGTHSLTAILADTVLTAEQKRGSLKVLFGLSDEDVNSMLGDVAPINPNVR